MTLPAPPTSPSPPPNSTSLANFTVSWGAEDVKMISMELGPPSNQMGMSLHDPSYSPHQESLGSDHDHQGDRNEDQMQQDAKRKRKFFQTTVIDNNEANFTVGATPICLVVVLPVKNSLSFLSRATHWGNFWGSKKIGF